MFHPDFFIYFFSQIATAFGPCGNNRDYIFLLEKAMSDIGEFPFLTPKHKNIRYLYDYLLNKIKKDWIFIVMIFVNRP